MGQAGQGGVAPWWSLHARNKRCITLNLKNKKAIDIVLRLVAECDALWKISGRANSPRWAWDMRALRTARPDLVIAHISGFGQDGSYRDRAAFGVIGEAIGGLRHLCNHPPGMTDLPPVRVGVTIGDSLAGLYAAFGIGAALGRATGRTATTRPHSRRGADRIGAQHDGRHAAGVRRVRIGPAADGLAHCHRRAVQRLSDLRRQVDS